ncbi:MAG: cyclic nucleotide-binding protein, partial [Wenzhouxiangellaceae bacterium]
HFRPALGLFGRLRFKSDDQGAKRMNLKKHGITPIVDLTRTWSLAEGLDAVATRDRLAALAEQNRIDRESTQRLQRAFDAIAELRIAHQLRRLNAGEPPDYLLLRDELSAEDERRLKRAYRHINDAQHALNRHFRAQDFT